MWGGIEYDGIFGEEPPPEECPQGVLPQEGNRLQGNLMTVVCESLHNLPAIVLQNVSYSDNFADVQVYMTLPHSQTDPVITFSGGRFKDHASTEPTHHMLSNADEYTQTNESHPDLTLVQSPRTSLGGDNAGFDQSLEEVAGWDPSDDPLDHNHTHNPTLIENIEGFEGDPEMFGDGLEDYLEYSEVDPRIVWNSVERKQIGVSCYRHMLTRLAQSSIWPIEVSVAVKQKASSDRGPSVTSKKKKESKPTSQHKLPDASGSGLQINAGTDSNEKMIMNELELMGSSETEYSLVWHGVAFVDLSCFVQPGLKSARFACRLYPYSNELLARKTCLTGSALPDPLLQTLLAKPVSTALDRKKGSGKGTRHSQASALNLTTTEGGRNSQGGRHSETLDANAASSFNKSKFPVTPEEQALLSVGSEGGPHIEGNPFIVFRISMQRAIVPCFKPTEISDVVDDYLPARLISRRKLSNASGAQQKYRKAVLLAAAEISHEFSEHYWKEVLQNGEKVDHSGGNPASNEAIKQGFLFYLNASGRYLILREHLRSAISNIVQHKCLNLRPGGFHNHRDFQGYLHDMYVFLVDEMHDILSSTAVQETDPLKSNLDRLLQQTKCNPGDELSKVTFHKRQMDDLGIFAEEALAQGDFETCHKLHLQRICRDKESSWAWTEFSRMWLSRGDERMAEIAVREALRKDPLHLYALLISGLLSVRHGDDNGFDCLGSALGLRPMSPEVLVILGIANSYLENHLSADYFFRKAAYVHRTITGQGTADLDKLFSSSRPFKVKQFTEDMHAGVLLPTAEPTHVPNYTDDAVAVGPTPSKRERGKGSTGNVRNTNKSLKEVFTLQGPNKKESNKRGSTMEANATFKSRSSMGKSNPELRDKPKSEVPVQALNGPKFTFTDDLRDIQKEEVELPPLGQSILSPWNVTEFSAELENHLLTVDYLKHISTQDARDGKESVGPVASQFKKSTNSNGAYKMNIPQDEGVVPDKELREAYDKLIYPDTSKPVESPEEEKRKTVEKGHGDVRTSGTSQLPLRQVTNVSKGNVPQVGTVGKNSHLKLTDRLGSELIWAAQLLINLRLFDFADGILAKQLYFYNKRTVQFIYLRALSLYLRQRYSEALPLIKEAIEMDNKNAMYWTLEGHCYYSMGSPQEAISSYEKALKLPHSNENRHLLYLRYGSLVLDTGKGKLAKRVFLHGVSKYSTPYMWLALGNSCYQRQEYEQAEAAFSEANRVDSTNPVTWGHLTLSSLLQGKKALAEQAYKWSLRFGLKKGPLLDEIHRIQKEKGIGDPSFPRVPNCVPHDYYLRRMGRQKPFNLYKEALNQDPPRMFKARYEDTENEAMLKKKLDILAHGPEAKLEWGGEDYYQGQEGDEMLEQQYDPYPYDDDYYYQQEQVPNAEQIPFSSPFDQNANYGDQGY